MNALFLAVTKAGTSSRDHSEACCSWHHCEHKQLCLAPNEQQSQYFCVREQQQQQSSASTHLLEKQQDAAAPAGSSSFWQQRLVRFLPAVSAIWSEVWQGSQGWGFGGCCWGPPSTTERYSCEGSAQTHQHLAPFGNGKIRFLNCCPVPCCAVPCYAVPCYAMSMSSLSSAAKTNQCTPTASPSVCQERPAPCFMPQGPLRCLGDYV